MTYLTPGSTGSSISFSTVDAALVATSWIESQLYGLKSQDPLTITTVALLMTAILALAGSKGGASRTEPAPTLTEP